MAAKKPLPRTGLRRCVPAQAFDSATAVLLPDGRRLWRATIASPGAAGLRVHFRRFAAQSGQLWLYAPPRDGEPVRSEGPFTGRGPFGDGEFWTGVLDADSVTIEYLGANPGSATAPPFEVDSIVHLWDAFASQPGAAAYCHLDVTCYPEYQTISKGVVQFSFVGEDGSSYVCSGAMINTRSGSFKPYLLTAHHCIGSDVEARSILARFFYQTSTCNGEPPTRSSVPSVLGATYLVGAPITEGDYTLVLLNENAPAETSFLGWNANGLELGDPAVGIHHPSGSWKRISFGNRTDDRTANVSGEIALGSQYYRVSWSQGKTEGGSSGSPLLNSQGEILGTLTYGPIPPPGGNVCDIDPEVAGYGRFANAYPAVRDYLEDGPPPPFTVTPANLTFTVTNGQFSGPSQQVLTIRTDSATPLPYSLTASAPWIQLSGASGNVSASAPASVAVTLDLSYFSASAGATGTVTVSSGTLTPVRVSIRVNVTAPAAKVALTVVPNPVYQLTADAEGYAWFFTVTVRETAGVAARIASFKIDGADRSSSIVGWFGSDQLPAGGALSASFRSRGLTPPVNRLFEAGGMDAGNTAWTAQLTVPFLGPQSAGAVLAMDSAPTLIRQNPNSTSCPWFQQLVVQESGGVKVELNRFMAGGHDLSSEIANYWGSTTLPANGALRAGLCWTITPPTTLDMEVGGADGNGASVSARASGSFAGPAANPLAMSASPASVVLNAPPGSSNPVTGSLAVNFDSGAASWTARLIFPNPPSSWLAVSPLSGTGPVTLSVTANPGGLSQPAYEATLVLESTDAVPQLLNIPVRLFIGASATAPVINPAGLVNSATYEQVAAPGMALSVYGERLALGEQLASTVPLPTSLRGASAAVNGRAAPLYYVSPGQLNLQVPFETEVGTATLTVTVDGQSASQQFQVANTAPGIYTYDGRDIVPVREAGRGDWAFLYVTGQGAVSPPVATGAAPPPDTPLYSLPAPTASVIVTVGGVPADLSFCAIPYGLVGTTQINYRVPVSAPTGIQPVVVRAGDKLSPAAYILVK